MAKMIREKDYTHLGDLQSQIDVLEAVTVVNPEQALKQALKMKDTLKAELGVQAEGKSEAAYAALPAHKELRTVNYMIGKIACHMGTEQLKPYIKDDAVKTVLAYRKDMQEATQSGLPVQATKEDAISRA